MPAVDDLIAELRAVVIELTDVIQSTRDRYAEGLVPAERMLDHTGRPLLGDLLAAKANALAALSRLEA